VSRAWWACRKRCDYLTPGELRRPYKHFARSRKGADGGIAGSSRSAGKVTLTNVSQDDLALAVRDLGMRLSSDQELALFETICLSGGNTFTYADFVVFVCDPNHADVVWKLRRAIAQVRLTLSHPIWAR